MDITAAPGSSSAQDVPRTALFTPPSPCTTGLAFDGSAFWTVDRDSDKLYRIVESLLDIGLVMLIMFGMDKILKRINKE